MGHGTFVCLFFNCQNKRNKKIRQAAHQVCSKWSVSLQQIYNIQHVLQIVYHICKNWKSGFIGYSVSSLQIIMNNWQKKIALGPDFAPTNLRLNYQIEQTLKLRQAFSHYKSTRRISSTNDASKAKELQMRFHGNTDGSLFLNSGSRP